MVNSKREKELVGGLWCVGVGREGVERWFCLLRLIHFVILC